MAHHQRPNIQCPLNRSLTLLGATEKATKYGLTNLSGRACNRNGIVMLGACRTTLPPTDAYRIHPRTSAAPALRASNAVINLHQFSSRFFSLSSPKGVNKIARKRHAARHAHQNLVFPKKTLLDSRQATFLPCLPDTIQRYRGHSVLAP